MDQFNQQLPQIKTELINAGKKHLDLLSDFYKSSLKRPIQQQIFETPSQRNLRWTKFKP